MVKFLKTFFRSKRDLENAVVSAAAKLNYYSDLLLKQENKTIHADIIASGLREINKAQEATIASLQRDLAATHAKILIQEETPPEALHGAGKGIRKKHTFLSERQRDSAAAHIEAGVKLEYVAKEYDVSLRTIQRIEKERCWLVS